MFKLFLFAPFISFVCFAQTGPTYAERLGWNKGDRVLILHMDDAGMSHDSNMGIEQVLEKGAARSLSVMMPTPWVPELSITSKRTHEPMLVSISPSPRNGTNTVGARWPASSRFPAWSMSRARCGALSQRS